MRTENIKVTFKIPVPVDKPDLNGNIYSKEAIENAVKNIDKIPLETFNDKGELVPIGVCQEVELVEDSDGLKICGIGLVYHGGTEETVNISDGIIQSMRITGIGIARE